MRCFFIVRLLLTPDAPAAVKYTLHALTLRCQDTVRIMLFRLTLLVLQYLNSFASHACKVYFTAAGASGVYPRYDK